MSPVEQDIELIIRKKVQGSTIYVLLGLLGPAGILLCPLSFIRCGQALRMIEQHGVGEDERKLAKQIHIASAVLFSIWFAVGACVITMGVSGL